MPWELGNAQHIGAREEQQDAFAFGERDGAILAVLADGMGGHAGGAAASLAAIDAFLSPAHGTMQSALEAAQQAVRELDIRGAGSTLIAAALRGSRAEWLSLGDSAILFRSGRKLQQLNTPHVFGLALAAMAESGKISWAEAKQHPEREALTHYLGMPGAAEAEYGSLELKPGDRLILASDGLTNALSDPEILDRSFGHPQEICERLLEAVLAKRSPTQDNVTILCAGLSSDQGPTRRLPEEAKAGLLTKLRRALGRT